MNDDSDLAFRRTMSSFAAGVTVVTCHHDGLDHAMTASAVMSVSRTPQLVAIGIAHTARFYDAIREQAYWAVSLLDERARDAASWLATQGRPHDGQLDRVPHHRNDNGIALLDHAVAWLECETWQLVPAGDHDLLIGLVDRAEVVEDDQVRPLLYWRSNYRALGELGGHHV